MLDSSGTTKFQHRLVFQLGFPFLLFVAFLIIGFATITYYSYTRDLKQAEEIPRGIAINAKASVTSFFDYLHLHLVLAANSHQHTTPESDARAHSLSGDSAFLENIVRANPAILSIVFFDDDGAVLHSIQKPTIKAIHDPTIDPEILAEVIRTGEEHVERPQQSTFGVSIQERILPAFYATGEQLGVMKATIDVSTLWAVISGLSAGGLAQVYLLDSGGEVLVFSNVTKKVSADAGIQFTKLFDALSEPAQYVGINGESVIGFAEKLPSLDWYVVAEVPVGSVTGNVSRTLLILLSFAFLFLILLSYEVFVFRHNLLTPLSIFEHHLREFGGGNYATRVVLSVKNEFLLLAATVNAMAGNIERQTSTNVEKLKMVVSDLERSGKLLIRRDLELTRANELLRELDEAKSEFVSVAAHQLRTPLSGIKWTLNLLLNGDLGPLSNEQKTFLIKSYESNERMVALINDLLSADRAESGKLKFSFEDGNIRDVIDSVLFEVLPAANRKEISVEYVGTEEALPKVRIDLDKIRAVIQNLLENAVKYTMKGGIVTVTVEKSGSSLTVSVKDSGIGISPDDRDKIFGRFFRGANAKKIVTDGSGLGLFIAKNIVLRHGGKIWFESDEGKGTTFFFTLPIA